jgi:hypothetical protein
MGMVVDQQWDTPCFLWETVVAEHVILIIGVDIITVDFGSVLLLEQQTSPSNCGVVGDLVQELVAVCKVTLVVLVHMLLKLYVPAVTPQLDNLGQVELLVECVGKYL